MVQRLNLLSSQGCPTQNPKLYPVSLQSLFSRNGALSPKSYGLSLTKASRNNKLVVKCRFSESYSDQNFTASRPKVTSSTPTATLVGESPLKVFVGHSIYKGKAALTVEPRAPEFASLESGAFKLAKEGFVLLQFAPAAGVRQYDWSRKQVFSLSVTEIGTLVSLGARDSCEFFHDPNKGRSDEGKVSKVLKVGPLPDASGHLFKLSVQNKPLNMDESILIPVTKAEYTVLISAFNYILPYLLGWHAFANSIKPDDSSRNNNASTRYGGDYEWSR